MVNGRDREREAEIEPTFLSECKDHKKWKQIVNPYIYNQT